MSSDDRRKIVIALSWSEWTAASQALGMSGDPLAMRVRRWLDRCWEMDVAPAEPWPSEGKTPPFGYEHGAEKDGDQ